jgi:hypothetical protein
VPNSQDSEPTTCWSPFRPMPQRTREPTRMRETSKRLMTAATGVRPPKLRP